MREMMCPTTSRFGQIPWQFVRAVAWIFVMAAVSCASPERPRLNVAQDILRSYKRDDIPRPAGPITLQYAVELALKHNPELRVLREEQRVVETLRTGAIQIKDPELRISYGKGSEQQNAFTSMAQTNAPWVTNNSLGVPVTAFPYGRATSTRVTTEDSSDYQATLRFFPPNPWLMRAQIREADAAVIAAQANVVAMEWDVVQAVNETFSRAQHLHTDIGFIDKLIKLGSNTISLIQLRVGQGTATLPDAINASKTHLSLINDRAVAERDYAAAVQELASLMGIGASDIVISPLVSPLPQLDPRTADTSFLESIAVRNRVDLAARILDLRAAEATLRRAESEAMPWITFLQASVGRSTSKATVDPNLEWTASDGFNGTLLSPYNQWEEDNGTQWRIDAGITLPLFSWMTNPSVAESAECRRKAAAIDAALKRIVADTRDAVRNLQTAYDNLVRYSSTSSPDATLLRSIMDKTDQQGTLRPDDRSTIETSLLEVERATKKLEYEYRQAYMKLSAKVGRDLSFLWGAKQPPAPSKEPVSAPVVPADKAAPPASPETTAEKASTPADAQTSPSQDQNSTMATTSSSEVATPPAAAAPAGTEPPSSDVPPTEPEAPTSEAPAAPAESTEGPASPAQPEEQSSTSNVQSAAPEGQAQAAQAAPPDEMIVTIEPAPSEDTASTTDVQPVATNVETSVIQAVPAEETTVPTSHPPAEEQLSTSGGQLPATDAATAAVPEVPVEKEPGPAAQNTAEDTASTSVQKPVSAEGETSAPPASPAEEATAPASQPQTDASTNAPDAQAASPEIKTSGEAAPSIASGTVLMPPWRSAAAPAAPVGQPSKPAPAPTPQEQAAAPVIPVQQVLVPAPAQPAEEKTVTIDVKPAEPQAETPVPPPQSQSNPSSGVLVPPWRRTALTPAHPDLPAVPASVPVAAEPPPSTSENISGPEAKDTPPNIQTSAPAAQPTESAPASGVLIPPWRRTALPPAHPAQPSTAAPESPAPETAAPAAARTKEATEPVVAPATEEKVSAPEVQIPAVEMPEPAVQPVEEAPAPAVQEPVVVPDASSADANAPTAQAPVSDTEPQPEAQPVAQGVEASLPPAEMVGPTDSVEEPAQVPAAPEPAVAAPAAGAIVPAATENQPAAESAPAEAIVETQPVVEVTTEVQPEPAPATGDVASPGAVAAPVVESPAPVEIEASPAKPAPEVPSEMPPAVETE